MDSSLTLSKNVDAICKSAFVAIRKIGKIRRFLDQNTAHRLIHAFVTSRLDCCNSLLFGLPAKITSKLQRIQNTAARLVSCVPRTSHITPVLQNFTGFLSLLALPTKSSSLLSRLIMVLLLHIFLNSFLDTLLSGLCDLLLNLSSLSLTLFHTNSTVNVLSFMQLLFFGTISPFKFAMLAL